MYNLQTRETENIMVVKKKSTDEGGLQNNQIKTQPKRTTI